MDDSIFEIIAQNCKYLEFLKVSYCTNNERNINISNQLIHLKDLTVKRFSNTTNCFISNLIKESKTLVSLNIEGKSLQLLDIVIHACLISLYKLLFCSIGNNITNSDIKTISELEKLERLNLSKTAVTDHDLQYMCNLKELKCHNCWNITNSGLEKFIKTSPNLELLDISHDNVPMFNILKNTCELSEIF